MNGNSSLPGMTVTNAGDLDDKLFAPPKVAIDSFKEFDWLALLIPSYSRVKIFNKMTKLQWQSSITPKIMEFLKGLPKSEDCSVVSMDSFLMTQSDISKDERVFIKERLFKVLSYSRDELKTLINLFNTQVYAKSKINESVETLLFNRDYQEFMNTIDGLRDEMKTRNSDPVDLDDAAVFAKEMEELTASVDTLSIRSHMEFINEASAYKKLLKGWLIAVAAETGIGKTAWTCKELLFHAINGKKVLWIVLGDMDLSDIYLSIMSIYFMKSKAEILADYKKFFTDEIRVILSRIKVDIYPADEITMTEIVAGIRNDFIVNYFVPDVIALDYDGNLKQPSDFMYDNGGIIYNEAKSLAGNVGNKEKALVYICSQTKKDYWGCEIVPKDGLAESSKKQHSLDLMITLGCRDDIDPKFAGKIYIAKNRRGPSISKCWLRSSSGNFYIVDETVYVYALNKYNKRDNGITDEEIRELMSSDMSAYQTATAKLASAIGTSKGVTVGLDNPLREGK